ncbi:alpha/beta fold hydrolase [Candidatus Bathyarchaeota archaeon]|nr:alpha/beta fold hydrolase [Candidatus Bathyarchaeota archaeon]
MPFLSVNGKELFTTHVRSTEAQGNKGVTVLCIHGLGSAHSFYSPLVPGLTASGYDVVAYDTYGSSPDYSSFFPPLAHRHYYLGSGQSKFKGGEQNVQSMAADVEALMQKLGLDSSRTILVGHSMGGMVACEVASRRELLGVVLLGPVHPAPGMGAVFAQRIENVMNSKVSCRSLVGSLDS